MQYISTRFCFVSCPCSVTASSPTCSTLTLSPTNSTALCSMLVTARREGRLVCGVYMCGKALDHDLDDVMLCVLLETSPDDVTNHMHAILIEAFCVENDVRVVKVDCAAKLRLLLRSADSSDVSHATPPPATADHSDSSSDLRCLLVMVSKPVEMQTTRCCCQA